MSNMKFDMRSAKQIINNDWVSTSDNWAVFDRDDTTCLSLELPEQDRFTFFLFDRSRDQSFDKIFIKSWVTKTPNERLVAEYRVSVVNI